MTEISYTVKPHEIDGITVYYEWTLTDCDGAKLKGAARTMRRAVRQMRRVVRQHRKTMKKLKCND